MIYVKLEITLRDVVDNKNDIIATVMIYVKLFNGITLRDGVDNENDIIIVSPWFASSRNGKEDVSIMIWVKLFY